jgi:hypothetical protein
MKFAGRFALTAALLSLAVLIGCGGDDNNSGRLRVFDAMTNAGPVDVYLGSTRIAQGITFNPTQAPNIRYTGYGPGTYQLHVFVANANPATAVPILSQQVTLNGGRDYTVILVGRIGGGVAILPSLLFLTDNNQNPDSNIRLRVVHAAPLDPAVNVDVYVTNPNTAITTVGPSLSNVPYLGNNYIVPDLNTGQYQIQFTTARTKTVLNAASTGTVDLNQGGTIRTIVMVGDGTGNPRVQLAVLQDRNP